MKNPETSNATVSENSNDSDMMWPGLTTPNTLFASSPIVWKPHAGQRQAVKFLLSHPHAILLASPGCGKTSSVLATFKVLMKKGLATKMLVVAPLRPATLVWPPEIRKWIEFNHFRVVVLHGKDKQKILDAGEFDIAVINYEGLPWLFGATSAVGFGGKRKSVGIDLKKFKTYNFDTLVADECSRTKHVGTTTYKILKQAAPTFQRRWGLTGSPASNGLIDLFGQIAIIDGGRALGQYITHYRSAYFLPHPSGFGWRIRPGAEPEIYQKIAPVSLRLDAADFIDMPDLVFRKLMFDLPDAARKLYDQVEEEMYAEIDAGKIVAANAAAASSKCRQIVDGGVYLEEEPESGDGRRKWENLHGERVEILYDLIQELQGEPILVAYEFRHSLDRILKRFGKDVPFIGGGISSKRAAEIEQLWNRGEIPLLAAHARAAGHGLNLQGAGGQICWHSLTFDLELYQQFIARVHRQGQRAKRVFVHHILARDTIDETIYWALQRKDKTQTALLDALKQRRRK